MLHPGDATVGRSLPKSLGPSNSTAEQYRRPPTTSHGLEGRTTAPAEAAGDLRILVRASATSAGWRLHAHVDVFRPCT